MVYQKDSKFVAVITCNGKILRDFKNDEDNYQVKLPFGSEYGIRLKNLNTTRCAFTVYIDGEDVLDGSRIILDPNESHDLEGFMSDNAVKNKFKFIEKTKKISEYRGDKIDDGMIRIEYQFEKKPAVIEKKPIIEPWRPPFRPHIDPWDKTRITWTEWTCSNSDDRPDQIKCSGISQDSFDNDSLGDEPTAKGFYDSSGHEGSPMRSMGFSNSANNVNLSNTNGMQTNSVRRLTSQPEPENEDGITVKGSQTNIQYKTGWLGEMEEAKHVMVLTLSGYKEEGKKKVAKAVTVKEKVTCPTCGTKNKSSNKFCSECGTSLV